MWFENSFRRQLLDMHINAEDGMGFLAQFDPDAYLENLLRAGVDSAMIYLQSHVGYCYYPTRTGSIHPAFAQRPGAMKKLADGCHAHGISVVAYYSLIYDRVEHTAHPDWRITDGAGDADEFSGRRYLWCCPNAPGYLDFTLARVGEILTFADFDGIFFDMPFWPRVCRCRHCAARWEREHGGPIPADRSDPAFPAFARARDGWLNEFLGKIADRCRAVRPGVTVEFNLASAALPGERMPGEGVAALSDFASGDLYRGAHAHSFACKLYSAVTRRAPFECMTSRCPDLKAHTLSRSRDQLRLSLLTVCAHHGANLVIDAIDPAGTMDRRFYDELGELYREARKYEKYMKTGEPAADVGLLFCLEGKWNAGREPYLHYTATLGAARTLTRAHIPYGVVTQATPERLSRFKCIVAAGISDLSPATADALRAWVEGGGALYFSGGADPGLLSLVGQSAGKTQTGYAYLAPARGGEELFGQFTREYPLPIAYDLPLVKTKHEVPASITLPYEKGGSFASIHSDPPGRPTCWPAMIRRRLGKGTVLWCAAAIEAEKSMRIMRVFTDLLAGLCGGFRLSTDAPEQAEAVIFSAPAETLVSFLWLTDDETAPAIAPFSVSVACGHPVTTVTNVTTGRPLAFTQRDGRVAFSVALSRGFAMIRLA